ncbi:MULTISPECIES: hypothetical protein [Streptomyces]|uniref:DUF2269 domain-containing protein n=1 Tax=Streptomyces antibioticus TaxID=1890 RepID=A0AAE7CJ23_STRAT|nr:MULTISPECIES: hypothetical protein [Streptomyces]GLV95145.1 hypothetical protein Slala04_65980 [Streptomyces lavendulae subsp. lavendulae]KOU18322.1 membrane protein [Streptomyces sp. WM6349]KOV50556.1 membrane protein [Streptomyces sp. H036]MCX5167378.1 hypothetical protein [Streptomyces antibioticus]OOQ54019.1 hypothetical protein AFM16_05305 [Streptomyces antibioticus]
MAASAPVRKTALVAHIGASVGWLGAVFCFLTLAVVGVSSSEADVVRGVYRVMEPVAWFTLVPLAFASLVTGLVQSWVTPWGMLRHYWVLFKLAITVVCTGVLLLYMPTFEAMAQIAATDAPAEAVRNPSPLFHAALALVALAAAMVLSVFKPKGLTRYGWRRRTQRISVAPSA